VFTGALLLVAAEAAAAAEQTARQAPDTIVVTGERVKRSIKDTASSVAVATSREIEASSADRIEQMLELVPNVQISSGGEGPTIRGQDTTGPTRDLPAFLGGTRPRTTLIVDGRAVTFNEFVFGTSPLWDVDRIELFRTPQTTTQGRNSIGGAIFVTTTDPSFAPEYSARAIVADAHTRQLSAALGGPLIPGQLAWRASGDYRDSRGSSRIADVVAGANPNIDRYGLLRFKLLATPSAVRGARAELTLSHTKSKSPQIEGVRAPFRERRDPIDGYGTFHTTVNSVAASFGLDREGFGFNAVLTGGDSRIRRFAPPGLGETQIHSRDWSGEAIMKWAPVTAVQAFAGVSRYGSRFSQYIDLSQLAGVGRFRDHQQSSGLFGELNWHLAAHATLTGGLRYQQDRQDRVGALLAASPIALDYHRGFEAWLPKVSFAYDFTPHVRAGVLVERAYNPGGTTLRFDTGQADDFGAERPWDYELFTRASMLADAVTLSANAFYYDQRNAQRAQPIGIVAPTGAIVTFADLFNVPKARTYGLETDVRWRASSRLSVRGSIGLLRTKVVDAGPMIEFAGKTFQRSPRFSASAAVEWNPVKPLHLSAQLRHNSSYFSDELNTSSRQVDGWTKADARAEWETGKVRLFVYARNLFDKFYLTYLLAPTFATAGDPRQVGLGMEARF
jgi:iron complex outermembrane recepter protein